WAVEEKASLKDGERAAIKYVSTRTVDEVGDVIVPKGVVLKQYKKSGMPVFWGHNYSLPPIGSDEWIKADDWGLKAKTIYGDTGEGTLANIVWNLVQQGHQKQSSVGIIPLETIKKGEKEFATAIKELAKEWPEFRKTMKGCRRIITKALLFEHSDVSLGCNQDTNVLAVSKMFSEAGADETLLKQLGLPMLNVETIEEEEDEGSKDEVGEEDTEDMDGVSDNVVEDSKLDTEAEPEHNIGELALNREKGTITLKGDTAIIK
ncbi:unnamed protein product, partial [marine sediment metagenome]